MKALFGLLGGIGALYFLSKAKNKEETTYTPKPHEPPVALQEAEIPAGWIPARPTKELTQAGIDILKANLGDPVGTIYPFELNGNAYAALVTHGGHSIIILQPDNQS